MDVIGYLKRKEKIGALGAGSTPVVKNKVKILVETGDDSDFSSRQVWP